MLAICDALFGFRCQLGSFSRAGSTTPRTTRSYPSSATASQQSGATHPAYFARGLTTASAVMTCPPVCDGSRPYHHLEHEGLLAVGQGGKHLVQYADQIGIRPYPASGAPEPLSDAGHADLVERGPRRRPATSGLRGAMGPRPLMHDRVASVGHDYGEHPDAVMRRTPQRLDSVDGGTVAEDRDDRPVRSRHPDPERRGQAEAEPAVRGADETHRFPGGHERVKVRPARRGLLDHHGVAGQTRRDGGQHV